MWILVIGLIVLAAAAMALGYFHNKRHPEENSNETTSPVTDGECCGQHAVCEKDSLLSGISKKIEYYDDEELDAYAGMAPGQYTDEQIEQFRDILYTMREEDVAGWSRSLQLRGISLPDEIKDEVFLIIGERRSRPQ